MADLVKEIKTHFKGDIASDPKTLLAFSRDASLFELRPQMVVFPKDVEDIKSLVKLVTVRNAAGGRLSLTARSAGTDMSGGALTESIAVSMTKYFNCLKTIGADYAVCEPGVYYRDFEKATLQKNLLLPSYPASREICTIGGMVANNSGGEKTLAYGKTENYVMELKAVLSDGNEYSFKRLSIAELEQKKQLQTFEGQIYRQMHQLLNDNYELLQNARPQVSKNSAGYYLWNVLNKKQQTFDLTKILTGSQGTLGIITEIKIRLIRPHTHSRLLVVFLKDFATLAQLVNHLLEFGPESLESYDDHTFKVAMKIFPDLVKKLKGSIWNLGVEFLPEFWMMLTGGIPKLVLLAEFTGDTDAEAAKKAQKAQNSLKDFHLKTKITATANQANKYWVMRRESFNLLRHHVRELQTAPFIDDIIVRPEYLPEFLPKLYRIIDSYPIIDTVAGHPGNGNFHIIPLMKLSDPKTKEIIDELSHKVYDLVLQYHGSITGEHNDGLIRSPYLEKMYGPAVYKLFEETKWIFDPGNIFNPGKKVNADLQYSLDHIKTT